MKLRPEIKGALIALLGVGLTLVVIWVSIGLRLGVWNYHDYQNYMWVTRGVTIGPGLWFGDINAGDDVQELIARSSPHQVDRFGRWVSLVYPPGGPFTNDGIAMVSVNVLAKDGALVQAGFYSCTYQKVFFNVLTPDDETEYQDAFAAYVDAKVTARQRNAQPDKSTISSDAPPNGDL